MTRNKLTNTYIVKILLNIITYSFLTSRWTKEVGYMVRPPRFTKKKETAPLLELQGTVIAPFFLLNGLMFNLINTTMHVE